MSVYDSSFSSAGDSDVTKRAKNRLYKLIKDGLLEKGFKTDVKFEVPATFQKKYHGDIGVLMRSIKDWETYHFFIVEIDDPSHATVKHESKDDTRDDEFNKHHGIATIRIPLSKIQGINKIEDDEVLFNDRIWFHLITSYISPRTQLDKNLAARNKEYAIELKENGKGTKCEACDHGLFQHDLTGCDWRNTNKSKSKCNCHKPVFRSDD